MSMFLFKLRKLFVIMTNDFGKHFVFKNHGFENSKLGIFLTQLMRYDQRFLVVGAFWCHKTNTFMLLWYELLFFFLMLLILLGEGLLRNGLENEQCWRLHMTCCSCIGVWSLPLCLFFCSKILVLLLLCTISILAAY
jgi:hypothetical protein